MRHQWLILSLLAACTNPDADDKAPGEWTPGKGDGAFELVEAGPATIGTDDAGKTAVRLESRVPAFRVESFGGTELAIDLASTARGQDAYLIVEGPLDNAGDRVAIGRGTIVAEDDDGGPGRDSRIEITLAQPGVYRVLAGTYESLGMGRAAAGALELRVRCTANCARGGIDQKTFVRAAQAQSGGAFSEYAKAELASLVHDPAVAGQLAAQLDAILADPDLKGLDRFPTFSLAQIATVRPALGLITAEPPTADAVISGELSQLLGGCTPDRSLPAEIDPRLPGVRYGQFPSATLSPCQFAHAKGLAQVLTSLATNNGSTVTFRGKTVRSPRELFSALVESGHTVQVRNERMYANFLSAIVGDKDLVWPVWLDTGIRLSNGESLTIPMGHSHHAWRISGPIVNTRVMFYLGISGTGFFAQTDARPAWSGTVTSTDVTVGSATGADYDYLLATLDAATKYLQRNRIERATVAEGMPADGYGYVGVCNDSNAALEHATKGTITAFPLLRAAALDGAPDLNDGLDATVKALPNDGDGLADPRDALRRAMAMQPGTAALFDARLEAQLRAARGDL